MTSTELATLTLLASRAEHAIAGDSRLDSAGRDNLEMQLRAALEEMAPAYHAAPEYCRAEAALSLLHLASHSDRVMDQAGSLGPLGAIRANGTAGAGSGSSTFEDDDATLS